MNKVKITQKKKLVDSQEADYEAADPGEEDEVDDEEFGESDDQDENEQKASKGRTAK